MRFRGAATAGAFALVLAAVCGCTAERTAVNNAPPARQPSKVPLHYKCNSCGTEISREAVQGGGFIAKCPNCGKPFLTM